MFLCSLKNTPMTAAGLLIPLICAALGWGIHRMGLQALFSPVQPRRLAGLSLQGLLPRRREQLVAQVAQLAADQLLQSGMLQEAITNPAHFKKIMPVIEE